MKAKTRTILEMAIFEGIRFGYNRSFKHVDNPIPGAVIDSIHTAVMDEIDTYFDFSADNSV